MVNVTPSRIMQCGQLSYESILGSNVIYYFGLNESNGTRVTSLFSIFSLSVVKDASKSDFVTTFFIASRHRSFFRECDGDQPLFLGAKLQFLVFVLW
jgi:hypothetical protein